MKKFYFVSILISFILLSSCKKDKYSERLIGTWRITDVDKKGSGGSLNDLPFRDGSFTFRDDGSLDYVNGSGDIFQGNWDMTNKTIGEASITSLEITVANYTLQQVFAESYDELGFNGPNHFKAWIYSGAHTFITEFRK